LVFFSPAFRLDLALALVDHRVSESKQIALAEVGLFAKLPQPLHPAKTGSNFACSSSLISRPPRAPRTIKSSTLGTETLYPSRNAVRSVRRSKDASSILAHRTPCLLASPFLSQIILLHASMVDVAVKPLALDFFKKTPPKNRLQVEIDHTDLNRQ